MKHFAAIGPDTESKQGPVESKIFRKGAVHGYGDRFNPVPEPFQSESGFFDGLASDVVGFMAIDGVQHQAYLQGPTRRPL